MAAHLKRMALRKEYPNIIDAINDIGHDVDAVLNKRQRDKYFDSIVLVYSFIENILKSMVYVELMWMKSSDILHDDQFKVVREYCKRMSFSVALQTAFMLNLIDWKLYKRIDLVRIERNDVIHQFWLYGHRGNRFVLRKKLEKLAGVASGLIESFNKLSRKVGVMDIIDVFL